MMWSKVLLLAVSRKDAKGWDEGMKSGKERWQQRVGPNTYHLLCLHTDGNKVSALPFMCKELRGKTETHCSYFFLSIKLTRWLYCCHTFGFFHALKACALLTYFEGFVVFLREQLGSLVSKNLFRYQLVFQILGSYAFL